MIRLTIAAAATATATATVAAGRPKILCNAAVSIFGIRTRLSPPLANLEVLKAAAVAPPLPRADTASVEAYGHVPREETPTFSPAARRIWDIIAPLYPTKLSQWKTPYVSRTLLPTFRRSDGRFVTYLPVTPSLRHRKDIDHDALGVHQGEPVPELTCVMNRTGGRDLATGRIQTNGRGGGIQRLLRRIDFGRVQAGPQRVVRVEFDPLRSAFVALLMHEETAALSYILAPQSIRAGDVVHSFRAGITMDQLQPRPGQPSAVIQPGNCLQLQHIPLGTKIHCVALHPDGPGILCRAAGTNATLVARQSDSMSQVRLRSGEIRLFDSRCIASIGSVSNPDWMHRVLGKAGRARHLGFRPKVRGVAMNPCDHPHGGGCGRTKGKHPMTPWGVSTKAKTRDPRKPKWWIVKPRPSRN